MVEYIAELSLPAVYICTFAHIGMWNLRVQAVFRVNPLAAKKNKNKAGQSEVQIRRDNNHLQALHHRRFAGSSL